MAFRKSRVSLGAATLAASMVLTIGTGVSESQQKPVPEKKAVVAPAASGDTARGRVVYKRNCEICHHSASTAKKIGPGLKGIYKRDKFAEGKPVNDDTMRVWIEDGGKDMPQFKNTLKPEQISDLIAYIRTL